MANIDYDRIFEMVNRVRTRWKAYLVLEGILYTCAVVLGWLFLGIVSDNLFHLPGYLRVFFLVVLLCLGVFLFYKRVISSLLLRISTDEAALYLESRMKRIDNRLINSLQLGRSELAANRKIIEFVLQKTLAEVKDIRFEKAVEKTRARNYSIMLSVVLTALFLYWFILPIHFTNALARLTNLRSAPLPITRISLTIKPGDAQVFAEDSLTVSAEPANSELPEEVFIRFKSEDKTRRERMVFDGNVFNHTIPNIQQETKYTVISDDFKSEWYTITTTTPLKIEKIDITFTFPEYLRIGGPFTLLDASEELRVLKGTHCEFHVYTNKEISGGIIKLDGSTKNFKCVGSKEAVTGMDILRDFTYRIHLKDTEGYELREDVNRRIYCMIDEAPFVEFLEPAGDFKGGVDKKLKVIVKARDDVAVASLKLLVGKDGGDLEDTVISEWKYNEGFNDGLDSLKTMAIESVSLPLSEHFKSGDRGYVYASVLDMKGSLAKTGKVAIDIISIEDEMEIAAAERESLFEKLREILNLQVYARKAFISAGERDTRTIAIVRDKQLDIYSKSIALVKLIETFSEKKYDDIRDALFELASNRMLDVVKLLDGINRSFSKDDHNEIKGVQHEIEEELRRLLGGFSTEKEEEPGEEAKEDTEEKNEEPASVLKEMQIILRNFIAEQKRVIKSSEGLASKKPEDFTREDEELKRKLQIIEDQWAKFLDEKSTELDKIPEQDFSKPTLIKELRQIYEEVDLAADELTKPGIHLPVTEEQIGLELAQKLEAKLESWLVDESDKIKWDLEEPSQDYDVPMAELPEELEDLIGDLIREEEGLDFGMEDVSSSWMDSLDEGAGWATMDGPISNMSAKGKTGNVLPNSSEISGRSGEGRQGKSNGEFVSDTAIGKGGRRTPTRLMNEPYERGVVQDEMTQETGGATGGGKLSGEGGEGVRGHVPPEVQMKISSVREKHSDIINRGERIAHQLNKIGYSSEKLDETIELMRHLDYQMKNFKYTDIVGVHSQIVEGLETSKDLLSYEIRITREENARLPKKIRRLLNDAMSADFPEDYDELLKGYYKSISR